jgi:uncharacterized protein (DUF736 family)
MAQIGTFTRGDDGSYTGTIKTLSLNIKARCVPAEPSLAALIAIDPGCVKTLRLA